MKKAKNAKVPSLTDNDPGDDLDEQKEESLPLDEDETARYRRGVGILLYLAADRWDVKRDTELMARRMKNPRVFDRRRLVKVIRYLKGTREFGHVLRAGRGHAGNILLDLYSDTNFAPDDPTKRAMTFGTSFVDGMPFSCFARRQGVQPTSSGEAEFYGASSVVMDGKVIWHLFEWLGYQVTCALAVDSAAAKGMLLSDGVGGE